LRAHGAPESQTLIVPSTDPETIMVPYGENATDMTMPLCASVSSLNSSKLSVRQSNSVGQGGAILRAHGAPESQTVIVPSSDPDTILVPSRENATDLISLLCSFVFSLKSPSAPARQANKRQFWPRKGDFELAAHPNPRL